MPHVQHLAQNPPTFSPVSQLEHRRKFFQSNKSRSLDLDQSSNSETGQGKELVMIFKIFQNL